MKRSKRNSKKAKGRGLSAWLRSHVMMSVAFAVVLGLIAAFGAYYAIDSYSGESTWIYIPRYASEKQIEDTLRTHLGDGMTDRTMSLWRLMGSDPKKAFGAYYVNKGRTAVSLSRALHSGLQSPVRFTFNSVRTMDQLYEIIAKGIASTPEEVKNVCMLELPELGYKTEEEFPAAFIPDTYEVYWNADARALIRKLVARTNKYWTDERLKKASELGLTPIEVSTIASIVEEETNQAAERPKVARLYLNRLKKNMKLQADPTVKFAIGDFSIKRISHEDLKYDSPYNTYVNSGLPPGPIRIPNASTLTDVLEAPKHDYLYMCAKEDFSGFHNFAVDYATHQANAKRYQAELNRRNIH